jgi:hypothetical protein
MSSSTVSVRENNQVQIRRIFSPAFLLAKKYGKPPVIRGYEPGQPVMEIMPTSQSGQKLLAVWLVWQWRSFPRCPYCGHGMGTAPSFRNYLQRRLADDVAY